jgi:putative tryptophan/tyrosine transport system substrate-binding protein
VPAGGPREYATETARPRRRDHRMNRRHFIAALGGAITSAIPQEHPNAQTLAAVKIGWLKIQNRDHTPGQLQAFRSALRTLGYVEGREFVIEEAYADGEASRLERLAKDLVRAEVRAIIATSQPALQASAAVTNSVPIIARMTDDPVKTGKAKSLASPGGNVTGVYSLLEEMSSKRLALLYQAVPSLRRVGALLTLDRGDTGFWLAQVTQAAQQLGLAIEVMDVRSRSDLEPAFRRATERGADGLIGFRNPTIVTYDRYVSELAINHRLPSVFDAREFVDAGALMSYGPNLEAIFGRLAAFVDQVLKGSKPGDIPIEQPTKFELVFNLKTARALDLTLPPAVLATADDVIE